ncbi:unnamed protein product [Ectocarpus sp. 8 AP-2014]
MPSESWPEQLERVKGNGASILKKPCVRNALMAGIGTGTLMGIHKFRVGRWPAPTNSEENTRTWNVKWQWLVPFTRAKHPSYDRVRTRAACSPQHCDSMVTPRASLGPLRLAFFLCWREDGNTDRICHPPSVC